jgi:hypothetical protein
MYYVTFQNGARTTLHSHESNQILIVTGGRGVIGLINGNSVKDFKIEDNDILFLEMKETLSVSLVTDCIFMVRPERERIFHILP